MCSVIFPDVCTDSLFDYEWVVKEKKVPKKSQLRKITLTVVMVGTFLCIMLKREKLCCLMCWVPTYYTKNTKISMPIGTAFIKEYGYWFSWTWRTK